MCPISKFADTVTVLLVVCCPCELGLVFLISIFLGIFYRYIVFGMLLEKRLQFLWCLLLKLYVVVLLTYLSGLYNLLQVLASANLRNHTLRAIAVWRRFRISSVVTFSGTQRWRVRPFLRLPPPLRVEEFTNKVGAIHTSDMTQPSKTLYFNTLHYVDVIVYIVQLLVPSYALF